MSLSYGNQSIDLLCKSIDWFLYERDIGRQRVKNEKDQMRDTHVPYYVEC